MKVLVTGGTGFVGRPLVQHLAAQGLEVVVLTRSVRAGTDQGGRVRFLRGDPTQAGPWQEELVQAQAVVNLAGESIFTRWTAGAKQKILESRVLSTRRVVQGLARGQGPGRVLLSASAVGYYGFHGDEDLDESGPPGDDFLAQVTQKWEAEALKAQEAGVRVVLMRFGLVLGPQGGALGRMVPAFRWGLGGRLGSGRQWFSWIHLSDLARAVSFLLAQAGAEGPFNLTAPAPVRNADLARALGRALGRPAFLPAPAFLLKLVLGEFGSVLLQGQKVLPRKLLDLGFSFSFPRLDQALADLVG